MSDSISSKKCVVLFYDKSKDYWSLTFLQQLSLLLQQKLSNAKKEKYEAIVYLNKLMCIYLILIKKITSANYLFKTNIIMTNNEKTFSKEIVSSYLKSFNAPSLAFSQFSRVYSSSTSASGCNSLNICFFSFARALVFSNASSLPFFTSCR